MPVAVETRSRASAGKVLGGKSRQLFSFEASREGEVVARLLGFENEAGVRVSAEIYPVTVLESSEPTGFFHDFPTQNQARRFVDETLVALEYIGCIVTDLDAGSRV